MLSELLEMKMLWPKKTQKRIRNSYNFDDKNVVITDQIVMKSDVISDQTHYSFLRQCKKKKIDSFLGFVQNIINQNCLLRKKRKTTEKLEEE